MAVKHVGNAVFIGDPISPQSWSAERSKRMRWRPGSKKIIAWLESGKGAIHPYVEFPSAERAYVGVALVVDGKVEETVELKEVPYNEPFIDYTPIENVEPDWGMHVFEEYPMVEVGSRKDWDRLKEAHDHAYTEYRERQGWEPIEAKYEGPGIYDGRDMTVYTKSAITYELERMESEAVDLIDYMFSGGLLSSDLSGTEWIDAFEKLMESAKKEMEESDEDEED